VSETRRKFDQDFKGVRCGWSGKPASDRAGRPGTGDGIVRLTGLGCSVADGVDQHGLVDATLSSLYKGHRFPAEIISHCVWLYYRFPLSLCDVEEMMAERGVSRVLRHHPPVVPQIRADLRET
jgi:hypothetical protein